MITNSIALQTSILSSNAAAYNLMRNSQARMDLAFGAGLGSMNMGDVFQKEQSIELSNLQNHITYLYNYHRQEALQKRLDKNIKDSFSYFA